MGKDTRNTQPVNNQAGAMMDEIVKSWEHRINLESFFGLNDTSGGLTWYDKDGNVTNDRDKVARIEGDHVPMPRRATEEEFDALFHLKADERKANGTKGVTRVFAEKLKKEVERLVQLYDETTPYAKIDFNLVATARDFIGWLKEFLSTPEAGGLIKTGPPGAGIEGRKGYNEEDPSGMKKGVASLMDSMSVADFFTAVHEDTISETDTDDFLEKKTDGYDPIKITRLQNDLLKRIKEEEDKFISENEHRIQGILETYRSQGEEVPYVYKSEINKSQEESYLDTNKTSNPKQVDVKQLFAEELSHHVANLYCLDLELSTLGDLRERNAACGFKEGKFYNYPLAHLAPHFEATSIDSPEISESDKFGCYKMVWSNAKHQAWDWANGGFLAFYRMVGATPIKAEVPNLESILYKCHMSDYLSNLTLFREDEWVYERFWKNTEISYKLYEYDFKHKWSGNTTWREMFLRMSTVAVYCRHIHLLESWKDGELKLEEGNEQKSLDDFDSHCLQIWNGGEKSEEEQGTHHSPKIHINPPPNPKTLFDIWEEKEDGEGRKKQYNQTIAMLKTDYSEIGGPFVSEVRGQLHWNKTPRKGWVQYMAAFIQTCIRNGWVLDEYSAADYGKILGQTFNVRFCADPFKAIKAAEFGDQYLVPFNKLSVNI
jgi:hypothetical protein